MQGNPFPFRLLTVCALGMMSVAQAAEGFVVDSASILSNARKGTIDLPVTEFDAIEPAVAAAPENRLALVVWSADDAGTIIQTEDEDDDDLHLVDGEFEIFGNIVDLGTQNSLTGQFRISTMGDDLETDADERARYAGRNPAVAWNPVAEEFLVVWEGDDTSLVDDEFEIFGQRVASDGDALGDRFRISAMGADGTAAFGAQRPAIAVNATTGEYLVVWQGDDDTAPLVDGELEIFGRMLDADAAPTGAQFRISTAGNDADGAGRTDYAATNPAVAFNAVSKNFVVAWQADGNEGGLVNGEHEIFAAQLDAAGGIVGAPQRVSTMGPDGDAAYDGLDPALAVDPATGATLIAWHGDTTTSPLVEGELEVHGRLLDATGVFLAPSFRISVMGPSDQRTAFAAERAGVAWDAKEQEFLVTWHGDTEDDPLVDDEIEIFGRFVGNNGAVPEDQFRVSVQGDDDEEDAAERAKIVAENPVVDYSAGAFFVVWNGELIDGQSQIIGRRAASTFTTLQLAVTGLEDVSTAPEPERLQLTLTNTGDDLAEDVVLTVSQTADFPLSFSGCAATAENVCEFGDIEPDEAVTVELAIATVGIELGDVQSTTLSFDTDSATALAQTALSRGEVFVPIVVSVEGGAGAIAAFWLILLGGLPLLRARLRRR